MRNARMTICLMVAVVFMVAGQGFGVIQFKDGITRNIDYAINDAVWVDYQAPSKQTTVNLLEGGYIYELSTWEDGRVNILGGEIRSSLGAFGRSHVTMSGGSVNGELDAFDSSQITIFGAVANVLAGYASSQVTISGGATVYYCDTVESSQITITDGTVDRLIIRNSSQATISRGYMNKFWTNGNSQATMSGGSVGYLYAYNSSQITLEGYNFAIDGTPFGFGEITSILGGVYGNEPYRTLTGTLANGGILDSQFQIGEFAKIVLVPEPATLLLLGLGGLFLRKKS